MKKTNAQKSRDTVPLNFILKKGQNVNFDQIVLVKLFYECIYSLKLLNFNNQCKFTILS